MDPYHVSATGHSLNYLPEYAASWNGYFADEGLDYSVSVPKPWDQVVDDLRSGAAQAALGGIWVPSMYRGRADQFVPFAKVSARAPLALMGRESAADFALDAMPGKVVLMKGSNGASVGLYFKMLLREHGIDPASVHYVQDLDGAMLGELFVGGLGDYLVVDQLSAEHLAASTAVNVVFSAAADGGPIPWSVYYSRGELAAQRDLHERFVRALSRGMRWLLEHEVHEYEQNLVETFPGKDIGIVASLAESFKTHGMWDTPRIDPGPYQRWQVGIRDGHLVDEVIPHDELVDDSVVTSVASSV